MAYSKLAVFGVYKDRDQVERAVETFKSEGFHQNDISVLFPDKESTESFAKEKHTKAPEGAAVGATAGMAIGGTLGWLVGIGSLAIPGVGPLVAAGPIMAALAGAGVGGALGTLSGALIGMGIPEYEAKRYEESVKQGGSILSVHTDRPELVSRARDVLSRTGAEQISGTERVAGTEHTIREGEVLKVREGEVTKKKTA